MVLKFKNGHDRTQGKTIELVVEELVKAHTRGTFINSGITDLTDSSGGTGGTGITAASVAQVNVANSSTSLAQKAATETALGTVKDALVELYAKANAYAAKAGIDQITYNGGGTAADGTVSAVTVSVTAAATGAQATETNAQFVLINSAFYNVGVLTNKLLRAMGSTTLTLPVDTYLATVPAIAGTVGTAADPGVTKVAVDAALTIFRTNAATVATKLNLLNNSGGNNFVVLV